MEGHMVSHYRILEKIGEGGMGQVYLAEDTSLERKVALKFLPVSLQPVTHERFVREAKSSAVMRDWRLAKMWLLRELKGNRSDGSRTLEAD